MTWEQFAAARALEWARQYGEPDVAREEFEAHFDAGPWHREGWYPLSGRGHAERCVSDGQPVRVRRTWTTDWATFGPHDSGAV